MALGEVPGSQVSLSSVRWTQWFLPQRTGCVWRLGRIGFHKLRLVTGLHLRPMKPDSGGRECSPSHQWHLLSKPCHRDPAQLTALRTSLWATQSPWRHPLPRPVVSWSPVVSVASLGQGPGALWTPWPPRSSASVSQGLWEFTLQRTCGCCPSPALLDLCFPLPIPPGLPDNLPVFGIL